jgi:anti-anti-sigma factor
MTACTHEYTPDCCPRCSRPIASDASRPARDAVCAHCERPLWFVRKTAGDVVVLTFWPGLIAGSECIHRMDEVSTAIGDAPAVVFNLSHLPFMSSLFLGMLVALDRSIASAGGKLRIAGLQPRTAEAFAVAKLGTIFHVCDNEQTALQSL